MHQIVTQTSNIYRYTQYGLQIASEIECPELIPSSATSIEPDVCIQIGCVPSALSSPHLNDGYSQVKPNVYLLRLDGIANYYVTDGRQIVIEPCEGCAFELIRLYLFSQCIGALLHQRHRLTLHASAIQTDKGAILFIGPSGAGKSTLAAGFIDAGYKLLAEDLCVIECNSIQSFQVMPGMGQLRLWADTVQKLGHDRSQMQQVWHKEKKYARLLQDELATDPSPILAIYLLESADIAQVTTTPLSSPEKLAAIVNNIFRAEYTKALGVQAQLFRQVTMLLRSSNIQKLTRPNGRFSVAQQIQHLQAELAC